MTRARMDAIAPFFIVSDLARTIAFYRSALGFETFHEEPQSDPFFAILRRGGVMIFFKHQDAVLPMPNRSRHAFIKWDAYVSVPDPDALAAEFAAGGLTFHTPLGNTTEGLRGFEVRDPDGYVLFFGRPR